MITIIILIYMVIGIMVAVPLSIIGLKFGNYLDLLDEDKILDISAMLCIGIGALVSVIIWPYWIAICVYESCLKPDKDCAGLTLALSFILNYFWED